MPSQPIPINTNQSSSNANQSGSPLANSATTGVGLSSSAGASLFGKWNAFSPLKSTGGANMPAAGDPKAQSVPTHDDHDWEHDPLEFGDLGDLRARGWAAAQQRGQRRAMSMSASPTTPTAAGGFKPMSPQQATVLRDNLARGEGALRRLSLGGFGRPTNMPPAVPNPPNPTPMGSLAPESTLASHPPPPPADEANMRRGSKGRRFSESGGRRRGVSPMGERLLRDHL